ncbi:mycofactocin system GMC family oxidoreductase MftG [Blastococcus sp. MG754426]|uniref:mycofactocin dehydrogenase MftG n=1 Tax=unclassified Blastococcus TaxID=2619396 RepID=UPI001EF14B06|nr:MULTISPECIES: mycofactocin system GMC family oxidoreductase MftG [unclassified Blastococcus]MCF6509915.1 mycofactocin system GMC family oxidoreductase MftG [Blastococcus sp. MG754426]MCF6514307.1 mycofactocin system GMC family oxidoreductase MftG [Blastococcus sp. MG754427]
MAEHWDVVVVGAGTAGCPLAARLADAGRRVLLLEAGAHHPDPASAPAELRDATSLRAAVSGHPANWDLPGLLPGGRAVRVPRGRVSGGSSAVNAGYFVRPTPADAAGWAAAGNDLWAWERLLPALCRLESDREYGDRPGHGADGPVPVTRPAGGPPLARAFAAAAEELGLPAEPDKNGGGAPGYGPLPRNVVDGERISTATAYLAPRRGHPGLTVRGGTRVLRVLVERGRAVGVRTAGGDVRADEVVLSAGAVGSAHLLLLSGIGPPDRLRAAGLDVLVGAPGVGAGCSDHPLVYLPFRARAGTGAAPGGAPLDGVLHATSAGAELPGDLEVLPWLAPFAQVMTGRAVPGDAVVEVGVALQRTVGRGRLVLAGADPAAPPVAEYGHLVEEADRRRMREGVRLAADLLRTRALAEVGAPAGEPAAAVLADDAALDAWITARLTTAVHLSGSARMGPEGDPGAVVDQELRVRGVEGLRVADTSVLPWVPSRGPAATAVLVGERAAELMTG